MSASLSVVADTSGTGSGSGSAPIDVVHYGWAWMVDGQPVQSAAALTRYLHPPRAFVGGAQPGADAAGCPSGVLSCAVDDGRYLP